MSPARRYSLAAALSLSALLLLCLFWELWWAPLRPGGSWLALKALPLLAVLPGTWRGRRRTHQWLTLLAPAYMTEGLVRALSEEGTAAGLAAAEALLASALSASAALFVRADRKSQSPPHGDGVRPSRR